LHESALQNFSAIFFYVDRKIKIWDLYSFRIMQDMSNADKKETNSARARDF